MNDFSPRYQRVHNLAAEAQQLFERPLAFRQGNDIVLCSVVVYELRYSAERSADSVSGHAKLDLFLSPFASLPFDDQCARKCAEIRAELERTGRIIGPHDLQISAIALQHGLTLVTHNTGEFSRVAGLKLEGWEL